MLPGAAHFEAVTGDVDPAVRTEAADRCATLLVRGAHGTDDEAIVARVVHLADSEGLDTLADLWSASPADSLAGCLWRLYLLRSWVYADPAAAAREFDAGRLHTPVHEVVAGVVDPPGPDEVRALTDQVLRGVVRGDFADTLVPRRGVRPRRCRRTNPGGDQSPRHVVRLRPLGLPARHDGRAARAGSHVGAPGKIGLGRAASPCRLRWAPDRGSPGSQN